MLIEGFGDRVFIGKVDRSILRPNKVALDHGAPAAITRTAN